LVAGVVPGAPGRRGRLVAGGRAGGEDRVSVGGGVEAGGREEAARGAAAEAARGAVAEPAAAAAAAAAAAGGRVREVAERAGIEEAGELSERTGDREDEAGPRQRGRGGAGRSSGAHRSSHPP